MPMPDVIIKSRTFVAFVLGVCFFVVDVSGATALDLSRATVVFPSTVSSPEKKAITMLIEEVQKRTQIRWETKSSWPSGDIPVIAVGPLSSLQEFAGQYAGEVAPDNGIQAAEGYRIRITRGTGPHSVFVIGNDARGVLFGVGHLLRALHLFEGQVMLDDEFSANTAPHYPLRGHQLGYRPKTNSYDAWDLATWEQYLRDLVVFGCNAIELIPPRSDDAASSPHFPRPPMEMMIGMSHLADEYGLDVWVWYPAMDSDYSDPKTVEFALNEWAEVFRKLPRIDAVFVPGGDPGHTPPKHLMALLEKQTANLHRFHPRAQMWVSPQSFTQEWLDEFLSILKSEQPTWLTGVVYGPQVRVTLPQLRARVPQRYPVRHYPDITHSRQCQYPVPDWDTAFAITEARECINPRPLGETMIFRHTQTNTIGFITYSEGCNDDVNKTLWSALGWNPEAKAVDILREYGRYFIGERYTDDFAQGLLALERNWQGPLLSNASVDTTLGQFQAMEEGALPRELKNWRFQQALFRAYCDAYTRARLLHETELEERAMERLRDLIHRSHRGELADPLPAIPRVADSLKAIADAEEILEQSVTQRVAPGWRSRIFELANALYQSIRMQLSVEKYKAISVDRGAMLDTLDYPLNNRRWLKERFKNIRKLTLESERLKAIDGIVNWTNPGPGGFYDDLGNVARQPHLVRGAGFERDPASFESARAGFEEDAVVDEFNEKPEGARRFSWIDHAESLFDAPLTMRYPNLDLKARYKIRVVYAGDSSKRKIRLMANEGIEVHPFIVKEFPSRPVEFDIPPGAVQTGELNLSWYREPGLGGNGRGCQISEVWLIKPNLPSTGGRDADKR